MAGNLGGDLKPHEHIQAGIRKAVAVILNDKTISARKKAEQIKALLLQHEQAADDADTDDAEEGDADDMDAGDDFNDKPTAESFAESLRLGVAPARRGQRRSRKPTTAHDFAEALRRP